MQRIINDPNLVVEEMLYGFVKSHPNLVTAVPENPRVLKYVKAPVKGKSVSLPEADRDTSPRLSGTLAKTSATLSPSGRSLVLRPPRRSWMHSRRPTVEPELLVYTGITQAIT
jgi:hypothetical protein